MTKFVLSGADGNLGVVAAEFAIEIIQPEDQLVFTTYKLENTPKSTLKRRQSKGVEVHAANFDDIGSLEKVFESADAVAFISTWLSDELQGECPVSVDFPNKSTGQSTFQKWKIAGLPLGCRPVAASPKVFDATFNRTTRSPTLAFCMLAQEKNITVPRVSRLFASFRLLKGHFHSISANRRREKTPREDFFGAIRRKRSRCM